MSEQKKVMITSRLVPPEFSGAGYRAIRQAESVSKRGVDVIVYNGCGVREYVRGIKTLSIPWYINISELRRLNFLLIPYILLWTCIQIRYENIELVHCIGTGSWFSMSVILSAKMMGIRCVIEPTMCCQDDSLSISKTMLGSVKHTIHHLSDEVVAISPAIKERTLNAGFEDTNCYVIPNPVDHRKFKPVSESKKSGIRDKLDIPKNTKLLLTVGEVSRRKGTLRIVKSFARINEDIENTMLAIVGPYSENDYMEKIRNEICTKGIGQDVLIAGKSDKIPEWMKISDVYLFASRREGLPNVLLEAMSTALPVVARNINGITDYIIDNNEDGYIVKNDTQMVRVTKHLIRCKQTRTDVGKEARQKILENYTNKVISNMYKKLYERKNVGN